MTLKKPPIDSESFYTYINDENLFQKARLALKTALEIYSNESKDRLKKILGLISKQF